MLTWQQGFTVILLVQVVSLQVEQVYRLYQQAVALKVRKLHKGHRDHSQANALLDGGELRLLRLMANQAAMSRSRTWNP